MNAACLVKAWRRRKLTLPDFPRTLRAMPTLETNRHTNRYALEWIIDQYHVTKDEQGNIVSEPNRADDEKYIVNWIEKDITVSLDTMNIVKSLPTLKAS
jgi:predicted helicase